MYSEALTPDTQSVLKIIGESGLSKDFYLAGGTALALYFGHRFSVDLDWFTERFNYASSFRQKLEQLGRLSIDEESKGTFNGALNGVKVSFFGYPYPLISSKNKYSENVYLAGLPDIAAMKMEAVGNRGSYKDFIDIYFLLEKYSLEEILGFVRQKFDQLDYNEVHLLKALTYFQDAQGTPQPEMIRSVDWVEVKRKIKSEVQNFLGE